MTRTQHKARSNNAANNNQNICSQAVAKSLGVSDDVRYLHTISDLVRAARTRYTVRSRMSSVKGLSVGAAREKLTILADSVTKCIGFIVRVSYLFAYNGHVLFVGPNGDTVTDTDKRRRDRRKMTHCYIVYKKIS